MTCLWTLVWFGSLRPGLLRNVRTRPPGRGTGGVGTVWDSYEGAQASYKVTGECSSSFESPGHCADLRPHCPATQMVLSFLTSQPWSRATYPESSYTDGVETILLPPASLTQKFPCVCVCVALWSDGVRAEMPHSWRTF